MPFQRSRYTPINDQGHLYSSYRYIARQESHHKIYVDPLHDGSSLVDLLGLRLLPGSRIVEVTKEFLPRLNVAALAREQELTHYAQPVEHYREALLADAAAAAFGLGRLGRGRRSKLARRTAAATKLAAESSTRDVAEWLGVTPRLIQRFRQERDLVTDEAVRAVELQWRMRTRAFEVASNRNAKAFADVVEGDSYFE